ncbi:acyl carrier protein [Georgenia thermotolerans]|uniref:Acyl carrier protein n=1 Tax=Georgenia thermotolerans TaxID=527326 RepID=A0A7J5UKM0_9MICO|nr:acyl carrier protein [Georgenia thermotolerans]KAE8762830.1 acyl carrier protein [Georgenia thermotolerans]
MDEPTTAPGAAHPAVNAGRPAPGTAELRATVLRVLGEVAPEADPGAVDPAADLREELELDSMDVLNLAVGLFQATGVEVPERDYTRIVSVDGCVRYLAEHLGARA